MIDQMPQLPDDVSGISFNKKESLTTIGGSAKYVQGQLWKSQIVQNENYDLINYNNKIRIYKNNLWANIYIQIAVFLVFIACSLLDPMAVTVLSTKSDIKLEFSTFYLSTYGNNSQSHNIYELCYNTLSDKAYIDTLIPENLLRTTNDQQDFILKLHILLYSNYLLMVMTIAITMIMLYDFYIQRCFLI